MLPAAPRACRLPDLEHDVRATVPSGDGFWIDPDAEVAMQAVELDDVDDVVVHQRAVERPTGFRLHGFLQIFVFDLFVALDRSMVGFSMTVTRMRAPSRAIFTSSNRPVP